MADKKRDDSRRLRDLCSGVSVIPVLVVRNPASARRLAETLVDSGLHVIEVTLRTEAALQAIAEMSRVPNCVVGAGTLLSEEDARNAKAAGARFGVSPGRLDEVCASCDHAGLPLLPGVATATEIACARGDGYSFMKFFPAAPAGGVDALKAFSGPYGDVSFCPTGGINADNALSFLRLGNVTCVGGSWVAPDDLVGRSDWNRIGEIARTAANIGAPD